jgi:hypothetical protein
MYLPKEGGKRIATHWVPVPSCEKLKQRGWVEKDFSASCDIWSTPSLTELAWYAQSVQRYKLDSMPIKPRLLCGNSA